MIDRFRDGTTHTPRYQSQGQRSHRLRVRCMLPLLIGGLWAEGSEAQVATQPSSTLRVYIDCEVEGCDLDYFRTQIPIIDYMRQRQDASLHILITSEPTAGGGLAYTLAFIGLREHRGLVDTLKYIAPQSSTDDQKRKGLVTTIKLGLVRFLAKTSLADRVQISYGLAQATDTQAAQRKRDPWNLWVFRLSANGNFNGEKSQHSSFLRGSTSANRTSEEWKIRISVQGDYSENKFTFSDGSKFASYSHSYGATQLVVKSLAPHWSAGERGSISSSTFLNQKRFIHFGPAIEYDLFPYSESTRRLLTFQYSIALNHFLYEDTTIFDKLSETRVDQTMTASVGLKQPWGSVTTSLEAAAYVDDLSKRHAVLFNALNVRLFKGLSVNAFLSVSLLRDQLYLAKGELSDEDILVRRRQLASSYSYFAGVGLSYSFGSIFNNVVNPRFEGASGGVFFF
ncbi:MAG TPA: hypothetical protein VIF83_14185 [Gemmatimonadaceae bacterium]